MKLKKALVSQQIVTISKEGSSVNKMNTKSMKKFLYILK